MRRRWERLALRTLWLELEPHQAKRIYRRGTAEAGSNLMSLYSINDPKHWFDRAKEARALAEQMDDPEAKRTMLKNADDYERLAQRAQERAAGRWPQSK
jgi:hypothetical protein